MVLFFILVIFLMNSGAFAREEVQISEGNVIFIGDLSPNDKLSFQPSQYCLTDENALFSGFSHRIHDTNVFWENEIKIPSKKFDQFYLFIGSYQKDLTTRIQKIGDCDPNTYGGTLREQQIRLDWLPPENRDQMGAPISWVPGITNRERLKDLEYFSVSGIRKLKLMSYVKKGEMIEVKVRNPLSLSLKNLTLVLHYEGGKGKPMPLYKRIEIPELAHKKRIKKTIPIFLKTSNHKNFRLEEIRLKMNSDEINIDAGYYLGKNG